MVLKSLINLLEAQKKMSVNYLLMLNLISKAKVMTLTYTSLFLTKLTQFVANVEAQTQALVLMNL